MRKTLTVTVPYDSRDRGKQFLLTEMPAVPAERWATRFLLALTEKAAEELERAFGMDQEELASRGMAAFATLGVTAFAKIDQFALEPLLDEMMSCVRFIPDPAVPSVMLPWAQAAGQIEEVQTILYLRSEVVALHVGFSIAGFLSIWNRARLARQSSGENTETSEDRSEASSLPVSPLSQS